MRGRPILPEQFRCLVMMPLVHEPCWRLKGHGGPHRSRWAIEQARISWVRQ